MTVTSYQLPVTRGVLSGYGGVAVAVIMALAKLAYSITFLNKVQFTYLIRNDFEAVKVRFRFHASTQPTGERSLHFAT